jgi:hypothetical protein
MLWFSFLSLLVRRLFHEPGDDADVSLRAPGRLQDVFCQDDPGDGGGEKAAAQVNNIYIWTCQ